MSIIIRLQNLPWSANALDIRQYFHGLSIPEGGVHIVGGELGDAFIAFSTDEDARQAFNRNEGQIKGIQIKLMLSSRQEMQRVIEKARSQSISAFMLPTPAPQVAPAAPAVVPLPAAVPAVVPAAVPEVKAAERDLLEKRRDRRRSKSRSKSRERDFRKDRSRDRKDRKHRDRSRSRSRERRERRRRDRSRSRNRSRSRERRRERSPKREPDITQRPPAISDIWTNQPKQIAPAPFNMPPKNAVSGIMGNFPLTSMDPAKRSVADKMDMNMPPPPMNGFQGNNVPFGMQNQPPNMAARNRDGWQSANASTGNNFQRNDNFAGPNGNPRSNFMKKNDSSGSFDANKPFLGRENFGNGDEQQHGGPPVNACVSMEPFYGSYGDLRRFFSYLRINYKGIKVINDEFGHKTGICFVQFRDNNSKMAAMKKNGQKLNNIEIKIESITDQAFQDAIDRYHPRMDNYGAQGDEGSSKFARHKNISKYFNNAGPPEPQLKEFTCLKIEDLPTYVKEQDILHIFSQYSLLALHLSAKPRGGSVAYVKFVGQDMARQALEERSHHVIGGKAVTVKPCKDEEFDHINGEQPVVLDDMIMNPTIVTDCLSLDNLPAKTTDRDISDFFSDIGVIPTKIHLMNDAEGFTRRAYCEFEDAEEAAKALSKDNSPLGPNTVSVMPVKRSDIEMSLGDDAGPSMKIEGQEEQDPDDCIIDISMSPPQHDPDQAARPNNFMVPPHMRMPGGMRPLLGEVPQMRGRGGPRGGPRFGGRGRGAGPRFNQYAKDNNNFDEPPPGCTVYMDNVPYKAGTDEILDFFDGYSCTNNVSRRYNSNNTPSAEAKVLFYTSDEAFRAVRDLNGKQIWDREIYLRQV